jgi:hypothetical protein
LARRKTIEDVVIEDVKLVTMEGSQTIEATLRFRERWMGKSELVKDVRLRKSLEQSLREKVWLSAYGPVIEDVYRAKAGLNFFGGLLGEMGDVPEEMLKVLQEMDEALRRVAEFTSGVPGSEGEEKS